MKALAPSSAPVLDAARAEALARSLHRAAVAWAHTFLHSRAGLDPTLLAQLTSETLAFGLALLDERLRSFGSDAGAFAAATRQAAWAGHGRWCKSSSPAAQLSAGEATTGDGAQDPSEFTLACHRSAGGGAGEFTLSAAMHAEFCALTGLGTHELVGGGTNLAAIVFYLVVHGRVFARRPDSREERRWLVGALRECREYLERALDHWLAEPKAAARPVSARIGR